MPFNPKYYTKEQLREYYKKYYQERRKKKLAEARKNNPTYKICPMCGTKFESVHNAKYCCEACKTLAAKIRQKIYRQSDKYKEFAAKYRQTNNYKESQKKYKNSEKYKKRVKEYWQSEKGKAKAKKYSQSVKGKATYHRYYLKRKANGGKPLSETNSTEK